MAYCIQHSISAFVIYCMSIILALKLAQRSDEEQKDNQKK